MNPAPNRAEYEAALPTLLRLRDYLLPAFKEKLEEQEVQLAFPLEARIKNWESILGKLDRGVGGVTSFRDFQDLVGIRIIVLFPRDVVRARKVVASVCHVIDAYDTAERLKDNRFGYLASHLIVRPHPLRTKIRADEFVAEVQIRTAAQHVWALVSQLLQYKSLDATPPELHRSVNRLAALAELMDLEFERLLVARDTYRRSIQMDDDTLTLDVEILDFALPKLWSSDHEPSPEIYGSVLDSLQRHGISTLGGLRRLIATQRSAVYADSLAHTKELLDAVDNGVREQDTYTVTTANGSRSFSSVPPELIERARRGVFYSLSGLTFTALQFAFGEREPPPGTKVPFPRTG